VARVTSPAPESSDRLRLAFVSGALLFLYGLLAQYLPAPGVRVSLVVALIVNLTLFAGLIAGLSPLRAAGTRALFVALLAAAVSVPFSYLGWIPAANVAKAVAAAGLGYWLAGAITSPGVIVLVAGLSAIVDIVSVATGPTKVLLERAPDAVGYLTVAFAWPGREIGDVYTALGVADLIFFALYVGAARSLGLRSAATVVAVALSIAVAVVAGMRVSAMPALPWMAAAFLAVNADLLFGRRRGRSSLPSSRRSPATDCDSGRSPSDGESAGPR